MDNNAFRAMVARRSSTTPAERQQAESVDRGTVRSMVNADLQRSKAKKHRKRAAALSEAEEVPKNKKKKKETPKYRDRALERRQEAPQAETYPGVDLEMSKFLGGDMEHTHLVKGLDTMLLAKARAQTAEAQPAKKKSSALSRAVERWLTKDWPRAARNPGSLSFDYDLTGPPLDATAADALPARISRSKEEHAALFDDTKVLGALPIAVVADAFAKSKRNKSKKKSPQPRRAYAPEPVDDDIFQGAGKYLPDLKPPEASAHRVDHDDGGDDGGDGVSSKYFAPRPKPQSVVEPPESVVEPVEEKSHPAEQPRPPTKRRIHRDPIGAAAKEARLARNIDGTDVGYGDAVTYESDDETYAMAKQRSFVARPKNRRTKPTEGQS